MLQAGHLKTLFCTLKDGFRFKPQAVLPASDFAGKWFPLKLTFVFLLICGFVIVALVCYLLVLFSCLPAFATFCGNNSLTLERRFTRKKRGTQRKGFTRKKRGTPRKLHLLA